jgi:hypothetical protein
MTLLFEEAWESIHYPTPPRSKKRETMMYNLTQKKDRGGQLKGLLWQLRAKVIKSYPNGTIPTRTRVSPVYSKMW